MQTQATTQLRSTVTNVGVSPLLLERYSRLAKIGCKDLSTLAAASECQLVPRDNVIYRQGDPARGVYVVLDGAVRLERRGPTQAIVDCHQAGLYATFGDSVLRGEANRLHTAKADAHSILVKLPLGLLKETLRSYPDLAGDWVFDIYSRLVRHARPSSPPQAAVLPERVFGLFGVA